MSVVRSQEDAAVAEGTRAVPVLGDSTYTDYRKARSGISCSDDLLGESEERKLGFWQLGFRNLTITSESYSTINPKTTVYICHTISHSKILFEIHNGSRWSFDATCPAWAKRTSP